MIINTVNCKRSKTTLTDKTDFINRHQKKIPKTKNFF